MVKADAASIDEHQRKLQSDLAAIIAQNKETVLPELERLTAVLSSASDEVSNNKKACTNDEQRLLELTKLSEAYTDECDGVRRVIDERTQNLAAFPKPESYADELYRIESSTHAIKQERDEVETQKKLAGTELDLQSQRREELDKLKTADEEALNQGIATMQIQRRKYDDNMKALGEERVKQHSLASSRVEIELNIATTIDGIKHDSNFLTSVDKRSVNIAKQALVKQESATSKIKDIIPIMQAKLNDLECQLSIIQSDKSSLEKEQLDLQAKLEHAVTNLLDQETIDERLKLQVDKTHGLVSNNEFELDRMRAEEKNSGMVLSITKEKRSAIRRKIDETQHKQHEIEGSIRLQQLIEIDLTKKHKDGVSKAKELATLCSMIENEKLETTRLVDKSNESLAAMKKKCDQLTFQLRSLVLERDTKTEALRLLRKDIESISQTRASYRRDKSLHWSSCRSLLEEISNYETRMEKLRATLSLARKEVERVQSENQQLLHTKQSLVDQLGVRKAQLLSLYNNSTVYNETLKRGESVCRQLEEEKKSVELQVCYYPCPIAMLYCTFH